MTLTQEEIIQQLKIKIEKQRHEIFWYKENIKEMSETIQRDREALAFYADVRNHELVPLVNKENEPELTMAIEHDRGKLARKRLGNESVVSQKYKRTKIKIGDEWLVFVPAKIVEETEEQP